MERHLDPHSTTGIYDEPKPWESKAWQSLTEELGVAGLLVPEDSGELGQDPGKPPSYSRRSAARWHLCRI